MTFAIVSSSYTFRRSKIWRSPRILNIGNETVILTNATTNAYENNIRPEAPIIIDIGNSEVTVG